MSRDGSHSSFFPTPALDKAAAGFGAGLAAVICMHPLDLLRVKYHVATKPPEGSIGRQIWLSLKNIQRTEGWKGLYRGIGPNLAGNACGWALYYLLYAKQEELSTCVGAHKPSEPVTTY
jgi:solute carrier family 25 folate transporter 32